MDVVEASICVYPVDVGKLLQHPMDRLVVMPHLQIPLSGDNRLQATFRSATSHVKKLTKPQTGLRSTPVGEMTASNKRAKGEQNEPAYTSSAKLAAMANTYHASSQIVQRASCLPGHKRIKIELVARRVSQ